MDAARSAVIAQLKRLIEAGEEGPALLPLGDSERFQFAQGDYGLVWPNPETGIYDEFAIDLAPECVRFFCERSGQLVKPARSVAVV